MNQENDNAQWATQENDNAQWATQESTNTGKGQPKASVKGKGKGKGTIKGIGPGTSKESLEMYLKSLEDPNWIKDPTPPNIFEFTAQPGLIIAGENRPSTPLEFFQLLVSRELLEFIVKETNDYAHYCKNNNFSKCKMEYFEVDLKDIANYIGLRILMAIIKLPEERMHWATSKEYNSPIFNHTMTFARFQMIGKYFHTYNREAVCKDNKDRLIIVRPVMEYIRQRCYSIYQPNKCISLDEGLMPHFGWLAFKVYQPKKPTKYGVKFYMVCESSTGYVLDWITYVGENNTIPDICDKLLYRYYGQGYHLYMDNFYNSPMLSDKLYEQKIHTCGTLRFDRAETPKILAYFAKDAKPKMERNTLLYRRRGNTFVLLWQDTRPVAMITNIHDLSTQKVEKRTRKKCTKGPEKGQFISEFTEVDAPLAVKDYNQYMSGVDIFDQKMNYYSMARRSAKWTKKFTMFLFQLALQNAHILYNKEQVRNNKKVMSLRLFYEEIYRKLIHFDETEWPRNSDNEMPHAESLPQEMQKPSPRKAEAKGRETSTPAIVPMRRLSPRKKSTDVASTSFISTVPVAVPIQQLISPASVIEEDDMVCDEPSDNYQVRKKKPRRVDPVIRLIHNKNSFHYTKPTPVHENGKRKGQSKQLACQVHKMRGERKDTQSMCALCEMPLCQFGNNCFFKYHRYVKYWLDNKENE